MLKCCIAIYAVYVLKKNLHCIITHAIIMFI